MAYQSEAELELQFIDQLNKQGYSTVSVPDYDALVENFKAQFEAFNANKLDKPLTDKEWERILNLMLGKSVFQSAKILRDKFVLEREDGTKVYLLFFDSDHTKNIFQVTHQTTVIGKYVNRYDVTILVNGLPLIQVELKRRGIDIREAVNQVMRYPAYVLCLLDAKAKVFAIRMCKSSEPKGFKFSKPRGEQKGVVTISSKNLLEPLRAATGEDWVPGKRYRVRGFWVADAKTMCFDLNEGVQENFRQNPANSDDK